MGIAYLSLGHMFTALTMETVLHICKSQHYALLKYFWFIVCQFLWYLINNNNFHLQGLTFNALEYTNSHHLFPLKF